MSRHYFPSDSTAYYDDDIFKSEVSDQELNNFDFKAFLTQLNENEKEHDEAVFQVILLGEKDLRLFNRNSSRASFSVVIDP